jgi:anti-sigma factor RsiW
MNARWLKRLSLVIAIVLMADLAFAGQTAPSWTTRIDAGSAVRVMLRNGVEFDAIWMGRDGDRAVFERFDPHETVSVPLEAVRKVKGRGGPSSDTAQAFGVLGAVAGFLGAGFLLGRILLPRT